jgi:hypothetical protein
MNTDLSAKIFLLKKFPRPFSKLDQLRLLGLTVFMLDFISGIGNYYVMK